MTKIKTKPLTLDDFTVIENGDFISKCRNYKLTMESGGFFYPCGWYYSNPPNDNEQNFWTVMVHTSYDYSFSFKAALEVLNMNINGTWKHGEGRYNNGL